MNVCNVVFSVDLDGQVSTHKTQGNMETRESASRISFSLEKESGLAYVFSVFKNKVTLSAKGAVSYSFTLREGENFSFYLNTLANPIHCVVKCKKLSIKSSEASVCIIADYTMDVGGNESTTKLNLKADLL